MKTTKELVQELFDAVGTVNDLYYRTSSNQNQLLATKVSLQHLIKAIVEEHDIKFD